MPGGHSHRAGALKQKNKLHAGSGGHASKRSMKRAQGGKVNAPEKPAGPSGGGEKRGHGQGAATISALAAGSKLQRLLLTKQQRTQKKSREWLDRRTGTRLGAPAVILIMPFGPSADVAAVAASLQAAADRSTCDGGDLRAVLGSSYTAVFDKLKCRFTVCGLGHGAGPLELLDAAKSADIVLAVMSAAAGPDGAVDEEGLRRVAIMRAHGMPAAIGYLQHMSALASAKLVGDFKRRAATFMADEFGDHAKLVVGTPLPFVAAFGGSKAAGSMTDGGLAAGGGAEDMVPLLRALSTLPHRSLKWREDRPYLLASSVAVGAEPLGSQSLGLSEAISSSATAAYPGGAEGVASTPVPVLAVSGYLRGAPLNVNQLVHVPGLGARRVLRILAPLDPCPAKIMRGPAADAAHAAAMVVASAGGVLLAASDSARAEPLQCAATPDGLTGEQTWPEDAEYGDEEGVERPRRKPAGVSDYQAAWMGSDGEDDSEEEEGGSERDGSGDEGGDTMDASKMVDLGSKAGQAQMRGEKFPDPSNEKDKMRAEDDGQFSFLQSDDGINLAGLDMDMTEEQVVAERNAARQRRAAEDMEFPDEVDAPYDLPAKDRFARYRSLESFRTSPWDAKETLPRAYSRLFDLGNFKVTQKRVLQVDAAAARRAEHQQLLAAAAASAAGAVVTTSGLFSLPGGEAPVRPRVADGDGDADLAGAADAHSESGEDEEARPGLGRTGWVATGTFVTLVLAAREDPSTAFGGVPTFARDGAAFGAMAARSSRGDAAPPSLHGLHRHENRLTLLNMSVQRAKDPLFLESDEVVASKESVWVVCGFRRWPARLVLSQDNLNCDKNKYERFAAPGAGHFLVASVYGPASFTPAPTLLFRDKAGTGAAPGYGGGFSGPMEAGSSVHSMQLVLQGTLGSCDVNRIVLKKIVLTGYPVRVHKRTAVIKHMFYKPEDVAWFKPARLVTKFGLEGHITQSVGLHGLFKVHFGRAIMGHDTVCLHLYKRVFPKFVLPAEDGEGEGDEDGTAAMGLPIF